MVWQYNYVLKDHLGNTRVTFADTTGNGLIDPTIEIAQINHFYPYGLNMEGNWNGASPNVKNKYQYNDKELQTDFGLNLNDYGARFYDPAIGRFTTLDPLAEGYLRWSPYHYGKDNPIRFVDPTGMASEAYSFGTQRSEMSPDDIMQQQSQKAEEYKNRQEKGNRVELYYTNDTKSIGRSTAIGEVKPLTAKEVVSIVSKAGKIMQKNGIKENIRFMPVSAADAKTHTRGCVGCGFVALISNLSKGNGNSNIRNDGTIGVSGDGQSFDSYVNYGAIADNPSSFPDPIYGTAFGMAHEYLHQLLKFASIALDKNPNKFPDHDDSGTPSLNTDGGSGNGEHHVKYPLKQGNPYELILPVHKEYLLRYFEYLKNRP